MSVRVDDSGVMNLLEEISDTLVQELAETMYKLGKIGEEEMRQKIELGGTRWSWLRKSKWGIGKSGAGRIDTGAMYDSVVSRPRFGSKQYQVEVGYFKNFKNYFLWQDQGFDNVWTGNPNAPYRYVFRRKGPAKPVEGLYALRDARQKMVDELPRLMKLLSNRLRKKGKI